MFGICGMVRFELARSGVKLRSSTNIIQLEQNQPTWSSFRAKSLSFACHNFLANMFNSRNLPVLRCRTDGPMVRRIFAGKPWLIVVKCLGFIFWKIHDFLPCSYRGQLLWNMIKDYHLISKISISKAVCPFVCLCLKGLGVESGLNPHSEYKSTIQSPQCEEFTALAVLTTYDCRTSAIKIKKIIRCCTSIFMCFPLYI